MVTRGTPSYGEEDKGGGGCWAERRMGQKKKRRGREERGLRPFSIFFFLCFFSFSTEIFRKGKNKKIK